MSKRIRKRFTSQEKIAILRLHLLEGTPVSDLCDKHGIGPSMFYRWQKDFFENGAAALVVQRNELAGVVQHSFSGLGVADTRDAVTPLAPFGEDDRLSLALFGRFGGKDDLKQPPHIRQRHAGLGFFSPDGAVAGPGTKAPT